ncbi:MULTISPECIES: cytidylyltransferase domain-containing protein [unclassified Microcella]|uniref:acylneuraminate cytidylyltransferase family protein n=1 Tax=unclassified Microcella TaxID=2630066 RepID=UPI0006FCB77D|nr:MULTISPECIES: acylneuraminate cytidylyltransferase family protein [unclassified Microcella]KQV25508.1 hypothetical protein ASC54_00405 [Yonghaparkia sp. Root332]KRF33683.1 hypothetical protein ASG83_07235 [Yonghaparkia sp. Soil809]
MSVIAVIPARGGSRGVPGKNLRTVGGRSLVARAVGAARAAASVDRVVVSTDDPAIAREAEASGAVVVVRPADLARDDAASESALLHALEVTGDGAEVLVFLQATSPFIDPADLDAAVARVRSGEADAVFSAIATPVFLWAPSGEASGATPRGWSGVNHDPAHRPRRQELPPQVAETGAFYVLDAAGFRAARHRFFGRVEPAIVAERCGLDIDTEEQLLLADALAGTIEGGGA